MGQRVLERHDFPLLQWFTAITSDAHDLVDHHIRLLKKLGTRAILFLNMYRIVGRTDPAG